MNLVVAAVAGRVLEVHGDGPIHFAVAEVADREGVLVARAPLLARGVRFVLAIAVIGQEREAVRVSPGRLGAPLGHQQQALFLVLRAEFEVRLEERVRAVAAIGRGIAVVLGYQRIPELLGALNWLGRRA